MYNQLMSRKIGIVNKSYQLVEEHLQRNIGSGQHEYDGAGTPIGDLADPDLNSYKKAWFFIDPLKSQYSNYLQYMNRVYFNGVMPPVHTESLADRMKHFDVMSLSYELNKVGVVRDYSTSVAMLRGGVPSLSQANPHGWNDTRMGLISNFYLNATLQNSKWYYDKSGVRSTLPRYLQENVESPSYKITENAYKNFGLEGVFGMTTGSFHSKVGTPRSNEEFVGNVLRSYDQEGAKLYEYNTMGAASSALFDASSETTKSFIAKSMLGINLLDEVHIPSLDENVVQDLGTLTTKKYYVTKGIRGKDYLSQLQANVGGGVFSNRLSIDEIGNQIHNRSRSLTTYAEAEDNKIVVSGPNQTYILGDNYGFYTSLGDDLDVNNDIVAYTNRQFRTGKYDTIIGRFHTNRCSDIKEVSKIRNALSSAVSQYGMSHGRNLLRKNHASTEYSNNADYNYSNPYCRVWTYHHQYHRLEDAIRPLETENGVSFSDTVLGKYQVNRSILDDNTVLLSNGMVQIGPTKTSGKTADLSSLKRCMFAIENLAWKQERNKLPAEQRGPLGGRIMWFPPYDLTFNENVHVDWSENSFIGRGEKIYTYVNTDRRGDLTFKLLIDHPSIVHEWAKGDGDQTAGSEKDSVDDVLSNEQTILRFFAGCEPLVPYSPQPKPQGQNVTTSTEAPVSPLFTPTSTEDVLYFYVFFPLNYSGVDDRNGVIKPMEYLANGIGCNVVNGDEVGVSFTDKAIGYEINSSSSKNQEEGLSIATSYEEIKDGFLMEAYDAISVTRNNGKPGYWGHRVDNRVAGEVLSNEDNYLDRKCYGLNGKGYKQLLQAHKNYTAEEDKLYSFSEVFTALQGEFKSVLSDEYSENRVNVLKEIFEKPSVTWDITKVEIEGFASPEGNHDSNKQLALERARSVKDWLETQNAKFKGKCSAMTATTTDELAKSTDTSDFNSKVWRCAKVAIHVVNNNEVVTMTKDMSIDSDEFRTEAASQAQQEAERLRAATTNIQEQGKNDWDTYSEYEFFEKLAKNDSFLHNKVTQKIKYFDPAYHSITPEGFNGRLTFLHQCTRQGSTVSGTDKKAMTASNLAFGAPPICVLRIGDFYHTKILINSLNIQYSDTTWDLNPEGIGVMPMMATVNIGFTFLGGSDLQGPISRLQNAVTFNYYANTRVYDDRADGVEYGPDGKIINYIIKDNVIQ